MPPKRSSIRYGTTGGNVYSASDLFYGVFVSGVPTAVVGQDP